MQPGEVLLPGQSISSASGRYTFVYQADGNLVLYGPGGALWASNTNGQPVGVTIMQGDGNLVIYGPNAVYVWDSSTHNHPGARAGGAGRRQRGHGRPRRHRPVGHQHRHPGGPVAAGDDMQPGEVLYPGQSISSANGRYVFVYQTDGNLVLYGAGGALWASNTNGQPVGVTIMQGDGNLVMHGPNAVYVWDSSTHNHPGARLVVQDDGNVVIYAPDGTARGGLHQHRHPGGVRWRRGMTCSRVRCCCRGSRISSASGRYTFVYQADGNLVLYGPGGALWASNTNGQPVGVTIMQATGTW